MRLKRIRWKANADAEDRLKAWEALEKSGKTIRQRPVVPIFIARTWEIIDVTKSQNV